MTSSASELPYAVLACALPAVARIFSTIWLVPPHPQCDVLPPWDLHAAVVAGGGLDGGDVQEGALQAGSVEHTVGCMQPLLSHGMHTGVLWGIAT